MKKTLAAETGGIINTSMPIKPQKKKIVFNSKVITLILMITPAIILKFIFQYLPMYGLVIAFQDYRPFLGIGRSKWVGFQHFAAFLGDPKFWKVITNTLILNSYHLLFVFPAPIIFAILVNEVMQMKFKKIVQTISYLPHFLSWVVVTGIFTQMLSPGDGLVNIAIKALGFDPVYFLATNSYFRSIIITADIWKGVGWAAVLYFAQIAAIDSALYEAAYIDGAGKLKQTLYITIPGMAPMIILQLLLTLSRFLSIGFENIFLLQNTMNKDVSDVISVYIYQQGLVESKFSRTTAMSLLFNVISYSTLVGANKLSKKVSGMGLY